MLIVKIISNKNLYIWSRSKKKIAAIEAKAKTIRDPIKTSLFEGQETLKASCLTLCINLNGFIIFLIF